MMADPARPQDAGSTASLAQAALDSVAGRLREFDRANAQVFIDHGEAGIALELICTQLYEYDIGVPAFARERIRAAVEAAGLDRDEWAMLRVDDDPAASRGQIVYLAVAYFRREGDFDADRPLDVIGTVRAKEARADIDQLERELRAVIASQESDDNLASLWLDVPQASFDPRAHGMTMVEWFRRVLESLSS